MKTKPVLVLVLAVAASSCGKKSNDDKAQGAKPATDDTKPVTPEPTPTPEPTRAPKVPPMSDMAFADWKIKFKAPAGTEVTDISPGDKEAKMPDNAKLSTESTCGMDVDISRHWKDDLGSFYDSAKKDDMQEVKFITDEKSDTAFKVYYTGKVPLGPMWGVETGLVIGDRLILCSAGMDRLTEEESACVLAVCTSIAGQ